MLLCHIVLFAENPLPSRGSNEDTAFSHFPPPSFCIGSAFLPAKIRFGNGKNRYFDFSPEFSLGSTFGARLALQRSEKNHLNILAGAGFSFVELDSINTLGAVHSNSKLPAFTASMGLMLEVKQLNLGLFSGIDLLSGPNSRIWQYQAKPWLSLGLGMQFLEPKNIPKAP